MTQISQLLRLWLFYSTFKPTAQNLHNLREILFVLKTDCVNFNDFICGTQEQVVLIYSYCKCKGIGPATQF